MKLGLEFEKPYKRIDNGTTLVIETANVDLRKTTAFSFVLNIPMFEEAIHKVFPSYIDGQITFVGKGLSKCHPDDEFDEKQGYYIAQSRAMVNIMKQYKEFMDYILKLIDNSFYNDIMEMWEHSNDTMFSLQDHINFDLIK